MSDPDQTAALIVRAIASGELLPTVEDVGAGGLLDQLRIIHGIQSVHLSHLPEPTAASIGTPPPPSVGAALSRWMHFELLAVVGRGSSGVVYRAWDTRLAREVALKLTVATDATVHSLGEAQRLARVSHPHVVTVYGAERADGYVGTWMELLKGRSLADIVGIQGPLSAREAALVGAELCSALAAVHAAGLLHRDVKAQNVFREQGGRVVLMDFGTGRDLDAAAGADLVGTPLYMAPELFTGQGATVSSDIYSVGVLLFFLTTGQYPVRAASVSELRAAHRDRASRALRDVRPGLERAFIDIVDRALAGQPTQRFISAGEMERILLDAVSSRRGDRPVGPPRALTRRVPTWAALVLVAASVAVTALVSPLHPSLVTPPALERVSSPTTETLTVEHMSPERLAAAWGFDELAQEEAAAANWERAAQHFEEAERILRVATSPDAPLVGWALIKRGWALTHAGRLAEARQVLELAVAKLRVFELHSLLSVAFANLAEVERRDGRRNDSADAIARAVEHRGAMLGLTAERARAESLATRSLLGQHFTNLRMPLDADAEGDWISDVFQLPEGAAPALRRDVGRDGVRAALLFRLVLNPGSLLAHAGSTDPGWLGFRQQPGRRFSGHANTTGRSWSIAGPGQNIYFLPLSARQRAASLARGWRLVARGTARRGVAFANVDFGPEGARFDLNYFRPDPDAVSLQLNISVVPKAGPVVRRATRTRWPLTELDFLPASGARLFLDGILQPIPPYPGHRQFQERLGLMFGSTYEYAQDQGTDAEFGLVMLELH